MEKWLGIGVLVQLVACAVVGLRLLGLARRTREIPELSLGLAFVLLGAVGYPLSIAARLGPPGEGTAIVLAIALAAQDAACLAIYVMNWQTFHKQGRIAPALVAVAAAGFVASSAGGLASGLDAHVGHGAWYFVGLAFRFGAFVWAATDSTRWFLALRRRQQLGLADPVVVDRFRLWSFATLCICVAFAVFLAGLLLHGESGVAPWVIPCTSLVSGASGVAIWLAFFPPRRYLARVAAR